MVNSQVSRTDKAVLRFNMTLPRAYVRPLGQGYTFESTVTVLKINVTVFRANVIMSGVNGISFRDNATLLRTKYNF